jgi:hypothetical protein
VLIGLFSLKVHGSVPAFSLEPEVDPQITQIGADNQRIVKKRAATFRKVAQVSSGVFA